MMHRRQKERGSQAVEMALVIVPYLGFMLLIMDMAWAVFVRSTLQHAVREGVRFAVTSRVLDGMKHDSSIKSVVQRQALGLLSGDSADRISIRYYTPGTLNETAANRAGNIVEVSVEGYQLAPLAALMHDYHPINMVARASDVMEGQPGGIAPER
jgi:Flp pilus assembly protein TadG